jgi:type II secretory pathway component PulK
MARKPRILPRQSVSRSAAKGKGSILIIALWSLCLLSVFSVILGANVRQKVTFARRLDQRDKLKLIAEAGVKSAISVLKEEGVKEYSSLNNSWSYYPGAFNDIRVGQGWFSISYNYTDEQLQVNQLFWGMIDEERKININKAPLDVLERLLRVLNFDESGAKELAASIVDWRDSDSNLTIPLGSAEDPYYRSLLYSYEAKDADFEILEELLLVKGVENDTFEKIKDYITVYGSGKVNINTATRPVLLALGLSEEVVNKVMLFRLGSDGVFGTSDDGIFFTVSDIVPKIAELLTDLNEAKLAQVSAIVQENLTTKSDNFMVKCIANLYEKKNGASLVCVINRSGETLFWQGL